jgi:8-oxo-dGTP pyrophosphatase MutT (NUDIX family)
MWKSPLDKLIFPDEPGRFGAQRKHDYHTGIDLYANPKDPVYAVEDGVVVQIEYFTGPKIGLPWWNDTKAIMVKGNTGYVVYAEVNPFVEVGELVFAGQKIAEVKTVLKKFKGRPTTMLHLELYSEQQSWLEWINEKPPALLDPTPYLPEMKEAFVLKDYDGISYREKVMIAEDSSWYEHTSFRFAPYAVLALIEHDSKALILKRSESCHSFPGYWCLPGGHIDNGETPEFAIIREVFEETNLEVQDLKLHQTYVMPDNKYISIYNVKASMFNKIRLSTEHTEYKWIDDSSKYLFGPLTTEYLKENL